MFLRRLLITILLAPSIISNAQFTCPPNIDFELGNTNNWKFYTGTCCPINTPTLTTAISNRHTLTSGTTNDPYGNFPIVAPGGGSYSLKLGNSSTGAQAERARYYVQVPAGVNNYSLIYRYAVVFENPSHAPGDQPRFEVRAYDSVTGANIPCGQFTYISSSTLPGFTLSSSGYQVWYKSWSTASIDLSGQGGKTIAVEFSNGDCALGGHFGYGYLDLNCSLFQIVSVNCNGAPTTTLTAPPGFQTYQWYNSGFSLVASGQTVTIATPATTSQYHVVLTPYAGYGCPDTLTTTVSVASLTVNASSDTFVCKGSSVQLNAGAAGTATSYSYSWTPTAGLSCTNCPNPVASPSVNTTYEVTVTDNNGCVKKDSVKVNAGPFVTTTAQDVSCFNGTNGSATMLATQGSQPYTFSWNTIPVQNTNTAINLPSGSYVGIVTDLHGCSDTANVTITQPTLLSANITSTGVSCHNANNANATAVASGGIMPYTYAWGTSPPQTTATASNLAAGSYTVTITDGNGCTSTSIATISQPPALGVNITAINVSCFNGTDGSAAAIATGGTPPYTYSWNNGQTTAVVNNLSSGSYSVTVTDNNGCTTTGSIVITQPQALSVGKSRNNPACFGGSGSATVTPTGGTPPYTYWWSTSPVQISATASGLTAGIYTFTVVDSHGCSYTDTIEISQPSILSASVLNTDVSCFGGNNGMAVVTASGGKPPYTYSWNTTSVQTSASANNLTSGLYTVTVTDNNGCTITAATTIAQPAPLGAIMSATSVSCFGGNNGSASVTVSGGTAPYSYNWNTSPVQTTSTINNLSAGNYSVSITDYNGCITSATTAVSQPSQLTAAISGKADVTCTNANNGSALVAASGGTPPYTYYWNTAPVQVNANATNLAPGNYSVLITDNKGCIDTASVTINNAIPLATVTSAINVSCFGAQTGQASITTSGGKAPYTYWWSTTPVQITSTAVNLTAGTYSVLVTDSNGCTKNDTVQITQPTDIHISSGAVPTCSGFNNGMAYIAVGGGVAPYTISWNTNPSAASDTIKNLAGGSYPVTVTDNNGCLKNASVVVPIYPQPNINAGGDKKICEGQSLQLLVNGAVNYTWYPGTALSCVNCDSPITITDQDITYIVTGTDANGCADTDKVNITVIHHVPVSVGEKQEICEGEEVSLHAEGGIAYQWYPSEGLNNAAIANPVSNIQSTTTYQVVITENECFKDTLSQEVVVHPLPTVRLPEDKTVIAGSVIEIPAQVTNATHIAWTPATNLSCSDCSTAVATLEKTITYVVTVTNDLGCKATDDINIIVSCDNSLFFMPNTFTPNGDGNNDTYFPVGKGITVVKKFAIYNRWGQKLYEATNIPPNDSNYGWDGTYQGEKLKPDVFVYMVEALCFTGDPVVLKGDVSLIR